MHTCNFILYDAHHVTWQTELRELPKFPIPQCYKSQLKSNWVTKKKADVCKVGTQSICHTGTDVHWCAPKAAFLSLSVTSLTLFVWTLILISSQCCLAVMSSVHICSRAQPPLPAPSWWNAQATHCTTKQTHLCQMLVPAWQFLLLQVPHRKPTANYLNVGK